MDKLVRVSDVIDWFRAYSHMDEKIPFDVLMTDLKDSIPAADVIPDKSKWITSSDRPDTLICDFCGCGFDMWKHERHNYCPNCGCKMLKE